MENLFTAIASVVTSGLISAGLVFLARTWISERLKNAIKYEYEQELEQLKAKSRQELERLKAELRIESDREIEQLKSQLQIAAAERSFRFSRVFEHTAKTIAETYRRLLELQAEVYSYVQSGEPIHSVRRIKSQENMAAKVHEFFEYYNPNRIYLPKETARNVMEFWRALHDLVSTTTRAERMDREETRNQVFDQTLNKIADLYKTIPALLSSLEDDFQKVLGLPISK